MEPILIWIVTHGVLRKANKELTLEARAWRDLTYTQAAVSDLWQKYMQLRMTFMAVLAGSKHVNKEELVSLYLAFQQNFANTLVVAVSLNRDHVSSGAIVAAAEIGAF